MRGLSLKCFVIDVVPGFAVPFSRVFDEQRRLYPGDRAKAVQETIRICMDKNVLKEYLAREEAAAVMFTIADQEEAMKEALEMERAEGEAEGEARGARKQLEEDARGMYNEGIGVDVIARIQKTTVDAIENILGLKPAVH